MRKIGKFLFIALLFVQRPSSAYAWGAQGHRLVVEMAMSLLSPKAKQRVLTILNGYPIDLAAVWMDSVRERKTPEWLYTKEWHFLNMDPGQTYAQVQSPNDVVFELERVINEFQHVGNINPDSLNFKLRVIFHLMGDISQPLHVGYGYDEGGNSVKVKTAKFNTSGNELHAVWDDIIIKEGNITLQSSLAYYKKLTQSQRDKILAGTTQDWMAQARSYLPAVYNFHLVKNGTSTLSLAYLDKNVPVVQQQIVYAAVRLANALNTAFGGKA